MASSASATVNSDVGAGAEAGGEAGTPEEGDYKRIPLGSRRSSRSFASMEEPISPSSQGQPRRHHLCQPSQLTR